MVTHEISEKIYYIGVNDRSTQKFEGLWPLPNGVSYNSYLIKSDEKTAVIDGVEISFAMQHIDHIKRLLGDRCPDHLIINHMEPDHSGSIGILRHAFPSMTIVGNAQTLSMVSDYYGTDCNTLEIHDGDTLALDSSTTLRFALTPMVHWPETMVTYFEEEQTAFTGDAFGCFGTLNGAVIDDQMDTSRYFPEIVRYYSNIVGKYGVFVQKALKKLETLSIKTICPTHGPVWRSELKKTVDIYDRLSRYEPLDNGVTIIYGSMYGNTAMMAEAAAEALAAEGIKQIDIHNASYADPSFVIADVFRHLGLIIAAPTYSDTLFPPVATIMEALATRGLKDRLVATFGSYTWSPRASKIMAQYLERCNLSCVNEPINVKRRPSSADLELCRSTASALAKSLLGKND